MRDDFYIFFGSELLFWDNFSLIKRFGLAFANFPSTQHSASSSFKDLS